jgi:hypothetical protein
VADMHGGVTEGKGKGSATQEMKLPITRTKIIRKENAAEERIKGILLKIIITSNRANNSLISNKI